MTLGDAVASAMAVTKDEDLKTGCEQIGRSARISFGVARKLMAAVNVEDSCGWRSTRLGCTATPARLFVDRHCVGGAQLLDLN